MGQKVDLKGQRFGKLVVVEEVGRSKSGCVLWKCRCDCGNETVVRSSNLRTGITTSCGCFNRERVAEVNTTHGMRRHPLYGVWCNMMKRTGMWKGTDEEHKRNYIDRDISVCQEWKTFENFSSWAFSHGYEKDLQIDRIDNDRDYCPDNCRWVTPKQNNNNRRNSHRLPDGTSLAEYAERWGIQTCSNNRTTKQYHHIIDAYVNHGADVAIAQVWGEAILGHFSEYGVSLAPFSRISILG